MRQRRRNLEEAQAELFNAKLSRLQTSSALQSMAVQKAQRAVYEVEEKLGRLKKWERELENLTNPLMKPVEQLQGFLATDLTDAVNYLSKIVQTLDEYVATHASPVPGDNLPSTGGAEEAA
jgi:hypothetical protein